VGIEEIIAPRDRCLDGLLPDRQIALPLSEQPQPVDHLSQERLRREQLHPGRGQFDGQRQAIQLPADGGYWRAVDGIEGKGGSDSTGALNEELYGVVMCQRCHIIHDGVFVR
jgi:hypothetical protein